MDVEMNQEDEEEELHRRLNCSNEGDDVEYDDHLDRFETMKQREVLKRWTHSMVQKGTSFKSPRN